MASLAPRLAEGHGPTSPGLRPSRETPTEPETLTPPRLTYEPPIPYPEEARSEGAEGVVRLDLEIDPQGRVSSATVVESVSPSLDAAALDAAWYLRFEPATEEGRPIPVLIQYGFRFVLPQQAQVPAAPLSGASLMASTSTTPSNRFDANETSDPPSLSPMSPTEVDPEASSESFRDDNFDVVVIGRRPPRSASDWTLNLGVRKSAPPPGTTGADLLRRAPGLYVSQHSGQGKGHQIFLRGFDAVHGQDVEVHVAGIPVNEVSNIHAQGYVDLHFLPPEVVHKLHVLAGPFDPRQGDFAVAGSIDYDLGLSQRGLLARTSVGQFGLIRGLVAWGPEGQPDSTFAAAEIAEADGFGPARAWKRAVGIGQFIAPLGTGFDLRVLASSYAGRFDSAGVIREDDLESGTVEFFDTYDALQGGSSGRHQGLLEVTFRDAATEASLSAYVVRRDLRLRHNFTGQLLFPEGDRILQEQSATTFGGAASYRRTFLNARIGLEVGFRARHDVIEQSQDRLRLVDDESHREEADNHLGITDIGLYTDMNLRLAPGLYLRGGVRIETLAYTIDERLANEGAGSRREASGFRVVPKVTLDWAPNRSLRLFASYGQGFRSPQAVSLGQGEESPFTDVHAGEVGGHFQLGSSLRTTLAGFVTYVEEDLQFDHATGQNLFSGSTLRGGGVVVVEAQPWSWLWATASATYTRAVQTETQDTVPFVPELVVRADLQGRWNRIAELFHQSLGLFSTVGITALSARPLPFSEVGTDVFIVEAAAGTSLGPVSVSAEAFNLLDQRWRDAEFVYASDFPLAGGSSVPARHFTAGRPFTLQGTVTVHF
ncbi:MAG: TonB-dependent receptor domain-containing protein [Myxococcota bacterium]